MVGQVVQNNALNFNGFLSTHNKISFEENYSEIMAFF